MLEIHIVKKYRKKSIFIIIFKILKFIPVKKWIKNERIMYKDDNMTKSYKKDCMEIWEYRAGIVVDFLYYMKKLKKIQ